MEDIENNSTCENISAVIDSECEQINDEIDAPPVEETEETDDNLFETMG